IDMFSTSVPGGAQNEPNTFREALTHPDANLWTQAALEELEVHQSPPTPSPAPVLRRSSRATKVHPPDGWHIPASVQLWPIADNPEELSTLNNADQMRYKSPEPWDEDPTE